MSAFTSMFARPLLAKQFARQPLWQGVRQRTFVTHSAVVARTAAPRSLPLLFAAAGIAGVGLSTFARPKVFCERESNQPRIEPLLNSYQLLLLCNRPLLHHPRLRPQQ